jgi:16S rRNA (guanine527-N7)-methyltransferase
MGIPVGEAAEGLILRQLAELARWNRAINLVSREEDETGWIERHVLDSLVPLAIGLVGEGDCAMLDLGAGAGFPGIPLAANRPGLILSMAEGDARKCAFLRHLLRTLPLAGARVLQGRFQDLPDGGGEGNRYDLVVTRAAAAPGSAAAAAMPFLRPGGRLLVWASDVPRETSGRIHPYTLPFSGRKALILEMEKLLDI